MGGRASRVTFDIRPPADIAHLTMPHEDLTDEADLADAASAGRPAVLSRLKSVPETGGPLPQEPWLVPGR